MVLSVFVVQTLAAQPPDTPEDTLRQGRNFIETNVYSQQEDQEILQLFEGLRVADVSDGMDAAGLTHVGRMDRSIAPLWRDPRDYSHRFVGVAVTARYVPTQQPAQVHADQEEFDQWVGKWYGERSSEPFVSLIRPGTALVVEDAPLANVGSIGSNNILGWKVRGCVAVVTSATARDTDEIITQRIPLYYREPGMGIRPGRNEIESVNRPIVVGGVLVMPGDIVIGDGDGVIVVPRRHAARVANYAHTILEEDKQGRRALYQELGLPADRSVE
jgi:regulator of RNase E activity RraA